MSDVTYDTQLLDDYLAFTRTTAKYDPRDAEVYTILGLASEAGEVADKYKKYLRDSTDYGVLQKDLSKELGDCLWYIFRCADEFGIEPVSLITGNINKLQQRKESGTLGGSGDDR